MLNRTIAPAFVSMLLVIPALAEEATAQLKPCLLVTAGTGSQARSPQGTQFWQMANAEIARLLVQQLTAGTVTAGTVAGRLEVLPQDAAPDKITGLVALALAREKCDRLLQFTHELGGQSEFDAYFAFEAVLFGVQRTDDGFRVGSEVFRKKYRYAMTDEAIKSLSMSEVASKLKGDLSSAGFLKR